jgi:hypothetical protein
MVKPKGAAKLKLLFIKLTSALVYGSIDVRALSMALLYMCVELSF